MLKVLGSLPSVMRRRTLVHASTQKVEAGLSLRPTTSSCWAGGWIEKKKANLILILFLKHLVLFTLKGLHTKVLDGFWPVLDSVPVRTGKGIYV